MEYNIDHRTKVLALKLYAKTRHYRDRRIDIPTISFEDLKVPFQDKNIMDMRNLGICVLSTDNEGKPGAMLHKEYADLNITEFQSSLKNLHK